MGPMAESPGQGARRPVCEAAKVGGAKRGAWPVGMRGAEAGALAGGEGTREDGRGCTVGVRAPQFN